MMSVFCMMHESFKRHLAIIKYENKKVTFSYTSILDYKTHFRNKYKIFHENVFTLLNTRVLFIFFSFKAATNLKGTLNSEVVAVHSVWECL